ncbi:MAG: dihydrofolate reductase [Pseudomonadales bacterium]|nr:dihydrofolate reductase [Pseudomonadales bacterium]
MSLHIIAACASNLVIGQGTQIPWRVEGEQKIFKQITMGGVLIMGRITYESIGRPLPGRTTIIVSRNSDLSQSGCIMANSIKQAIEIGKRSDQEIYIAGGGDIYRQTLPLADIVHLTTIDIEVEGDIYFPPFPTSNFELTETTSYSTNMDFVYQRYQRKQLS